MEITFQADIPPESSNDETVFLSLVDDVTGLALNTKYLPMQSESGVGGGSASRRFTAKLLLPLGSVVRYRYERQAGAVRVVEHTAAGNPVRYRLFAVKAEGVVQDIISRWTDTAFQGGTGRILGRATDSATGEGLPNLMATAGGIQTLSRSDGTFLLEGLPQGTHNLVIYALDGAYLPFQQPATISPGATTAAPVEMKYTPNVKVVFVVQAPEDTPPVVPLRMAGNLYQLGNSFSSLNGGVSGVAANMPVLQALPDGRFTISLDLPVGADIRYKYTLGDGFWNAEHTSDGRFQLRQLIVPEESILIDDLVETWHDQPAGSMTFDVTVPAYTPADEFVSIQFNPLFGWTEPLPMWSLGNARWAYILFSPVNLPGNFSYRYCRNGQCGVADDSLTRGQFGAGRLVELGSGQTFSDRVESWIALQPVNASEVLQSPGAIPRSQEFWAGVELAPFFHPSWKTLTSNALGKIKALGANWLVSSPTWEMGFNPPNSPAIYLEPVPGSDALWPDAVEVIRLAKQADLKIALKPTPRLTASPLEWWNEQTRDTRWWAAWYDQYTAFALHHADLAQKEGASAFILGGEATWPALPGGLFPDGSASDAPWDADSRWLNLLQECRQRYSGDILWAMPSQAMEYPPDFLSAVDGIYLEWAPLSLDPADLEYEASNWLDYSAWGIHSSFGKPVYLAVSLPSTSGLTDQTAGLNLLAVLIDQREWISGFIVRGYYLPAALQDSSSNIQGKPASLLLKSWFTQWLGVNSP